MTNSVTEALREFFAEAKYPVLFTGAGVSVRAGLPTWRCLIEQLAEGLRSSHPLMTQVMYECINDGDYTKAIDHFNLSQKMLEGDKQKLLQDIFGTYDANAILPVAQLPVQCCLTTNFDRSILDAFAKSRQQAPRDYRYGDFSFKQAQWEEQFFVARIHGAIEFPTSIVLSELQFKDLLKDDAYADFLGACFRRWRNIMSCTATWRDFEVKEGTRWQRRSRKTTARRRRNAATRSRTGENMNVRWSIAAT